MSNRRYFSQRSGTVYCADKKLLPRIKQYLSDHPPGRRGLVDINELVSSLQKQYPEYARKKRTAFKHQVTKVYSTLFDESLDSTEKNYLIQKGVGSNEDSDSDIIHLTSDSEIEQAHKVTSNTMNDFLVQIYSETTPTQPMMTSSSHILAHTEDVQPTKNNSVNSANVTIATISDKPNAPIHEDTNRPEDQRYERKRKGHKEKEKLKKKRKGSDHTKNSEVDNAISDILKERHVTDLVYPTTRFSDIGGCTTTLLEVCHVLLHFRHPEVFRQLGIQLPSGFLLHGPPGCGKSLLAHAIAGEMEWPLLRLAATELVSGVSGETEEKMRDLFQKAKEHAPCVLFLDEIDAISPKRETAQREMERRVVTQLLSCMDDIAMTLQSNPILVIGATNRIDTLDPGLRRSGRFDREISLGIPDEPARKHILEVLCRDLTVDKGLNYSTLAHYTPGYVGADLKALVREAAMTAINRCLAYKSCDSHMTIGEMTQLLKEQVPLTEDQLKIISITEADFELALHCVQPSSKREGFATVPDVSWKDIGALENVREELSLAILAPVRFPDQFAALGLKQPPGILLAGPPGCGKTLLAKAIANESGINFISVKGPELLNMYVGESERAVRQVFQRAKNSSPCVIFFDEIDALCPRRSDVAETSSSARVVNQLLTEMDGLETRKQVFVIGATNRPDMIDPAILRPGRLDKLLYVGLPNAHERVAILKAITKDGTCPTLAQDVSLYTIAHDKRCNGFSGADLTALVREAATSCLKEFMSLSHTSLLPATPFYHWENDTNMHDIAIYTRHFESAFSKVHPSVSVKENARYQMIEK